MDRIVHKFWLSKLRIKIKNHFFILKMDIKKWKFWCFSDLTDRSAVRGRTAVRSVRSVRSEIGPQKIRTAVRSFCQKPGPQTAVRSDRRFYSDRSAVRLPKTRTADRSAVRFGPHCGPCGRTAYPPCLCICVFYRNFVLYQDSFIHEKISRNIINSLEWW